MIDAFAARADVASTADVENADRENTLLTVHLAILREDTYHGARIDWSFSKYEILIADVFGCYSSSVWFKIA